MLHHQQMLIAQDKRGLKRYRLDYTAWLGVLLLIPCFWLGWKMTKENWLNKLVTQFAELITLTVVTYFRQQLMSLFKI